MLRKALVIKPTSYTIQSDPAFISIREKKNSLTFKEITTKKTWGRVKNKKTCHFQWSGQNRYLFLPINCHQNSNML